MCNLYSNTTVPEAMRNLFRVERRHDFLGNAQPLPSIFPGSTAPIVRVRDSGKRELTESRFGFFLPQKSKRTGQPILPKSVTNSRQEKVLSSPFWRQSFLNRRCLIPASAFCEMKGRRPAEYHWFGVTERTENLPFAFAGIWRKFFGAYQGEQIDVATHAIITTTPNLLVGKIHPMRMPVILDPDDYDCWLHGDPDQARHLLRPFPADRMCIIASGKDMKSLPN